MSRHQQNHADNEHALDDDIRKSAWEDPGPHRVSPPAHQPAHLGRFGTCATTARNSPLQSF
eukprot:8412544-Alexandrium_andersonii.AAC.1